MLGSGDDAKGILLWPKDIRHLTGHLRTQFALTQVVVA